MVVAIQCAWKAISKDVFDVLISMMFSQRMKVVIGPRGGSTR